MTFASLLRAFLLCLLAAAAVTACDDLLSSKPDEEAPLVELVAPGSPAVVEADTVVLEGVARDPRGVTRVTYSLNGAAEVGIAVDSGSTAASFRTVVRDLPLGAIELRVRAYDAAGNVGTAERSLEARDAEAPTITVQTPAGDGTVNRDSVRVAGTAEDDRQITSISYRLNGAASRALTADPNRSVTFEFVLRGLLVGRNDLEIEAVDVVGNADTLRLVLQGRDLASPTSFDPATVRLREVTGGLTRPISMAAPRGDPRLFVIEQRGMIRVIEDGTLVASPFLDISARVTSGGEQGLLGLAFHPNYRQNGYFYVNYIDAGGDTRIERYSVSGDRNRADPGSAKLILQIDQPTPQHNGGTLLFGPDGMLYIGMGDGAGAGDFYKNAQNPNTLLGALLRIDVDRGDPYSIPADNPFVGRSDARGEVWQIGLRNPWRFSFDWNDGTLYIGDVGEDNWEEINVVAAGTSGLNFGWPVREGAHCFAATTCQTSGFTDPLVEYAHPEGCSVTGGNVYRGTRIPQLRGHYLYVDFCKGILKSFRVSGGAAVDQLVWNNPYVGSVSAIGEGGDGELYLIAPKGSVHALESAGQ